MPDGFDIPPHRIGFRTSGHVRPAIAGTGNITLVDTTSTQALTNKTVNGVSITENETSVIIGGGAGELTLTFTDSHVATLPSVSPYTLATLAGTETFTNKTITSPVISTGLTASGSAANTFAGSTGTFITSSGRNTLSGYTTFKITAAPSAAAGSTVSDAAQLAASNIVRISSDGATKGNKLQTGVAGDMVFVINTSATAAELYAASGGTVNGLSADASVVVPASKGVLCFCTAADTWTVFDMPALAAAS